MIRTRDAVDSAEEDARFLAPLLTMTEAGHNLLISPSTLKDWKTRFRLASSPWSAHIASGGRR